MDRLSDESEFHQLWDTRLTSSDVSRIISYIKNGTIRVLTLSGCTARRDDWASLFMYTGTLRLIGISEARVEEDKDESVFAAHGLPRMGPNLKQLWLTDMLLDDDVIRQLVAVIPPSVTHVHLNNTGISSRVAGVLCKGLARLPELEDLNLGDNDLWGCFGHIASLIDSSPSIVALLIDNTRVDGQDLVLLARAIRDNPRFGWLDATNNPGIEDEHAREFIEEIGCHPSFRYLSIYGGGCSSGVEKEVDKRLYALHSDDSRVLVALCSGVVIKRLSPSFTLTIDVIRKLKDYL